MNNEMLLRAKNSYQNITNLIAEIGSQIIRVDSRFSIDVLIAQFDLILEVIMLNQALADGNFCDEEKEFIKEIVQKGDLIEFYNMNRKEGSLFEINSWESFQTFSKKLLGLLMDEINTLLEPIENEFAYYLALIDATTEKDELSIFVNEIEIILECLNLMDNEIAQEEKVAAVYSLMKHFIKRYKYYLISFKKGLKQNG